MKKLADYSLEELLLIYFNQSKSTFHPVKLATSGAMRFDIYADYLYSDQYYSDQYYSDQYYSDSYYSNSSYSNSDYSDSDYLDNSYIESDSYSNPGGRFYLEYSEEAYSDYSDYEYSDYSDNYYGDSGYSYSDYGYSNSGNRAPKSAPKNRPVRNPLHSFAFVISCLALLALPLVAAVAVISYNQSKDLQSTLMATIFVALPLLGIGLGIGIPKLVRYDTYITLRGRSQNPLKTFSFVSSFLIFALGLIYGVLFPLSVKDGAIGGQEVKQYEILLMIGSGAYWLLVGVGIFIRKMYSSKEYKKEQAERDRIFCHYVINKKSEPYIESIADLPNANTDNKVALKNVKTYITYDYDFMYYFNYEDANYLIVILQSEPDGVVDVFKHLEEEQEFEMVASRNTQRDILNAALEDLRKKKEKARKAAEKKQKAASKAKKKTNQEEIIILGDKDE